MQLSVGDLGYLVLGIVFLVMGLITLLLTVLRSAIRDASIILFGIMSCVWGTRFLLYTPLASHLLLIDPVLLARVGRGFTYFSGTAAFGFAWAFLGPGWRSSLRLLAYASLVFSCLASIALIVHPDPDLLLSPFNLLVLVGAVTVLGSILQPKLRRERRLRGLIVGFCLALAFIILENLRALALLPVPWDVEWIGVLILYITLGKLIAVRMFANERRLTEIRHELATARRIQVALLPASPPRLPGLTVAARYVPMAQVAGDIYDFIRIDERKLCILIADVSGHGIPAALIASMVKGAFRAQSDRFHEPHHVLAGMNRILSGQFETQFVTAACAYIDLEACKVLYSGAGHPPLLLQTSEPAPIQSLQENGLMLGPFPGAEYACLEHPLIGGERLFFCTDGILEAENTEGRCFGDQALAEELQTFRDLTAEQFADGLLEAVAHWTGKRADESHDDDLTLIVVDVLGKRSAPIQSL